MNVLCINLDRDTDRLAFVEANFAQHNPNNWELRRIQAMDKSAVDERQYGTKSSKGAIALSVTHRKAVQLSLSMPGHVMIAEDDIMFGPRSQAIIEKCTAQLPKHAWDILFTDVCIPLPADMFKIVAMKRQCRDQHTVLNLKGIVFAGTSGLVINQASKEKYLRLLTDSVLFSMPIDLLIRQFVLAGRLNCFCTFPFATSLSKYADHSNIQASSETVQNHLWNAFRRAVWSDADLDQVEEGLANVPNSLFSRDTQVVSKIAAALVMSSSVIANA